MNWSDVVTFFNKHNIDLKGLVMKLHIPIELANQIIGYLGTRPYQEVYQLIDGMKEAAKPPMTPLQEVPTEEQKAA